MFLLPQDVSYVIIIVSLFIKFDIQRLPYIRRETHCSLFCSFLRSHGVDLVFLCMRLSQQYCNILHHHQTRLRLYVLPVTSLKSCLLNIVFIHSLITMNRFRQLDSINVGKSFTYLYGNKVHFGGKP